MDTAEFERERRAQNDYLRSQIDALAKLPAARRRKFRRFELVCGGCGDTVVEVLDTKPYPVVRYRRSTSREEEARPDDWFKDPARYLSQPHGKHRGGWYWFPIADPAPPADQSRTQTMFVVCACTDRNIRADRVFDPLRRGEARAVVPAVR